MIASCANTFRYKLKFDDCSTFWIVVNIISLGKHASARRANEIESLSFEAACASVPTKPVISSPSQNSSIAVDDMVIDATATVHAPAVIQPTAQEELTA